MEKEFVPYEQSLALKELGFDEECFSYYNHKEEITYSSCFNKAPILLSGKKCAIPTFSQAFRWFREKYNWHSNVLGDSLNGKRIGYYFSITEEGWMNFYESCDDSKWYDTYEEAELKCLKKLIEIVKKK